MTDTEKSLILDLATSRISTKTFLSEYPVDTVDSAYLQNALKSCLERRQGDEVEFLTILGSYFELFSKEHTMLLSKLLVEPWHIKHEDLARKLQELRDPRCVGHVVQAMHMKLDYWYDDGDAFIRKCAYVLAWVGTDEAIAQLRRLSGSKNPIIAKYCSYQLKKMQL